MLFVKNLFISVDERQILNGVDLSIKPGEIHAVMGPNGAGKSTLALGLMGHPKYKFRIQNSDLPAGKAGFRINGEDMVGKLPEERARAGLFVSFQQPAELTGISILAFLRTAYKALHPEEKKSIGDFKKEIQNAFSSVGLSQDFIHRSVNEGFSGGEKKRAEIAQLLVLKPKYAILDEIDSGLDIDSLKIVAKVVKDLAQKNKMGVLLITHYQRILHHLRPDRVHIFKQGKIKKTGDMALVEKIEKDGYAAI